MAIKKPQSKSKHGNSKTGPKRGGNHMRKGAPDMVDAALRQTEALRLRQSGKTFQEIADALGYSDASGARNAVMAALRETVTEPNNEMRSLELARLDVLHKALWPAAITGDQGAIDRVLKLMERRARILGLDAPPKAPVENLDELIEREFNRINGVVEEPAAGAETAAS